MGFRLLSVLLLSSEECIFNDVPVCLAWKPTESCSSFVSENSSTISLILAKVRVVFSRTVSVKKLKDSMSVEKSRKIGKHGFGSLHNLTRVRHQNEDILLGDRVHFIDEVALTSLNSLLRYVHSTYVQSKRYPSPCYVILVTGFYLYLPWQPLRNLFWAERKNIGTKMSYDLIANTRILWLGFLVFNLWRHLCSRLTSKL